MADNPQPEAGVERLAAFLFRLARDEIGFGKLVEHMEAVQVHDPNVQTTYVGLAQPMGSMARKMAYALIYPSPASPTKASTLDALPDAPAALAAPPAPSVPVAQPPSSTVNVGTPQ